MKDFDECLLAFNKAYEKNIKNYKFLDKESSFTPDKLSEVNKIIEEFNSSSTNEIQLLDKRKAKLNDSFKIILRDHYKVERQNKKELKEKLKNIKDEADAKILELKNQLGQTKEEFAKNEYNSINDINFYIDASNQNIDMFEIECRDNLNRFSYQIDVAKSSYNSNIDTFNAQLEQQIERITDNYNKSIKTCNKSYEELVDSYNLIIEEKNKLIAEKKQEYHVAQVELKNKKRQESADLNGLIRMYSEEKSKQISEFRNAYLDAQKADNETKNILFNEYKEENYKANKDFVQSINELDAKIKDLRDKFEKYCDEENQTKYYKIFDMHTEQEEVLRQIIEDNKNNKKIKSILRKINKEFYKRVAEENDRCEKLLLSARKNYSRENSEGVYEKKLLDISRTTFFAKLNEKQIRDNKYYQEKTTGYEAQFNYDSAVATSEYNRNANKVLLDSSIRNLDIEKEIDETDAKFQIQIEMLSDIIKKYQLEITIAKKLNDLNILYLTEKYNREISFLTVSNLLKIEKCKVLDQYNIRQYELNIQNSNNVFEYSKNKINLQNEKYSALKKQDISIARAELQNYSTKNSYDISVIYDKCAYDQDISTKEAKHITSLNKTNLLKEKFIVELDEYENILQAYVLIYSNTIKAWNDILDLLLDDTTSDKLILRFVNDIFGTFKDCINNLTDTYKGMITGEINAHINFDNDFKYKDTLDIIKDRQAAELAIINNKKDLLVHESDLFRAKNDEYRLKLFTIQFDEGDKYSRSEKKKNIRKLIVDLKQNNKQLDILDKKIEEVNKEIKAVEKKYNKQINSLLYEQELDNQAYQVFSNQVNEIVDKIKKTINGEIILENLTVIQKYKALLVNLSHNALTNLFLNTSNFSEKYQISYNLAIEKINEEHTEDLLSTTEAFDRNMFANKSKFEDTNNEEIGKIASLNVDKNRLEAKYNNIIKNNDMKHQREINEILLAKKNSTSQFYTELYAVDDNLSDIESDYFDYVKAKDQEYENNKQSIIDDTLRIKDEYNKSLSNFIANRRAIINHLPIAIKENEKELIADYKEKNRELDLKLIQSKKDLNLKKANEKKNINMIELNYKSAIIKIESNDKIQKLKEKKNLSSDLIAAK